MHELWVEKYRPRTLDQYVWRDLEMRQTIESWINQRSLPHCLFSGDPGTGKTSLALLLLIELQIPDMDILKINASRERQIDGIQDKIMSFIDAWTSNPTGLKYIMLDEADKLSQTAQTFLRSEMETFVNSCRFILTANYPRKIITPLHSRLQEIKFTSLDHNAFALRAADVLNQEKVSYEPEVLMTYVERNYPDLRKCINTMQQYTREGQLAPSIDTSDDTKDYMFQVIQLCKVGRYRDARKLLVDSAQVEAYPDIFRMLYQNLQLFGETDTQQGKALLAIRDAVRNHSIVGDQEINMAALLYELSMIYAGA